MSSISNFIRLYRKCDFHIRTYSRGYYRTFSSIYLIESPFKNIENYLLILVSSFKKQTNTLKTIHRNIRKDFHILNEQKVPDGFGKFFPKKSNQSPPQSPGQSGEKPKEIEFKFSFGTNRTGGGSGGGNKSPDPIWSLVGFGSAITFLMAYSFLKMRHREITWKEFINQYLQSGMVEKLEVVNKKWVRVKFTPGAPVATNTTLWFNIGSVETFERNLENIQLEMNIEPANFAPVVYKNEIDR